MLNKLGCIFYCHIYVYLRKMLCTLFLNDELVSFIWGFFKGQT